MYKIIQLQCEIKSVASQLQLTAKGTNNVIIRSRV
jgi:hypothetical protein